MKNYKEWLTEKTNAIKNSIESTMNNVFGESCISGSRPSSYSYQIAIQEGTIRLRTEILILLNEAFDIIPNNIKNIEFVNLEITNIVDVVVKSIGTIIDEWITLHKSDFARNIKISNSMIAEINLDIYRETEKRKRMLEENSKKNKKDILWKIVTVSNFIITIAISIIALVIASKTP